MRPFAVTDQEACVGLKGSPDSFCSHLMSGGDLKGPTLPYFTSAYVFLWKRRS